MLERRTGAFFCIDKKSPLKRSEHFKGFGDGIAFATMAES